LRLAFLFDPACGGLLGLVPRRLFRVLGLVFFHAWPRSLSPPCLFLLSSPCIRGHGLCPPGQCKDVFSLAFAIFFYSRTECSSVRREFTRRLCSCRACRVCQLLPRNRLFPPSRPVPLSARVSFLCGRERFSFFSIHTKRCALVRPSRNILARTTTQPLFASTKI